MAKSSAAAGLSAEEIGFLAGGPGRAAEAALARLLDGGLVRVSREGLVTAVHQNGYGATTALEASILAGSQGTARPLQQVVQIAMSSQEMEAVRYGLVDRALVRRQWGKARGGQRALRVLLLFLGVFIAIVATVTEPYFLVLSAVLLFLVILMRDKGMLTAIGKGVLGHARRYPRGRVDAVALYGLRGAVGRQRVCDLFGLPSLLFHPAPVYHGKQKSSSHSSCGGGVYEHHHYNCGSSSSSCSSNSCGSSSSCSSSSSSSCSSSSSSSCSSSSS
jgi:uncharacterized protein (TIGR04222 family)